LADGDGNGAVGISDVAPIGMNFGGRIEGYELQWRQTPGDPWVMLSSSAFVPGQPLTGLYPQYIVNGATSPAGPQYRVVPYVQNGAVREYGAPSNIAGFGVESNFGSFWNTARGNINRDGFMLVSGPLTPLQAVSVPLAGGGMGMMFNEPVSDSTGTIYIGAASDFTFTPGITGWFYAVTLDGKLRWRFRTFGGICGAASCSRQARVVVGDMSGMVYCFAPDGKMVWQRQLSDKPALTAPLVADDGTVYVVAHTIIGGGAFQSSTLYRLSKDGVLDWSRELNGVCLDSPVFDPLGDIAVINDKGQVVAYSPGGLLWFQFNLADPQGNTFSEALGVAIQSGILYYSTDNNHVRGIAYNNTSTNASDLAGDNATTMPALNLFGNCIVGAVTPGVQYASKLKCFSNNVLSWELTLGGGYLSNFATDVQARMYFAAYEIDSGGPVADNGIHCIRLDETKDWFYATGENWPVQVALVADKHLAVTLLTAAGAELLIISGS
jgi:hypothetical protein